MAAVTAAIAAGLTEMAASFAVDHPTAGGDAADTPSRAHQLRLRAVALADEDARAYAQVPAAQDADQRRDALQRATEVPLEVVEVAREVVSLAAPLTDGGRPALRGDARVAVLLAAAAAQAATELVRWNVRAGDLGGALIEQAERWCADVDAMAERADEAP